MPTFQPGPGPYVFPAVENNPGIPAVTGTGGFAAQACAFSGTAVERFIGSGGIAAAAASFSGTGRLDETGTGSFAAAAASFAGTGHLDEVASGAFAAQPASFAGTGNTFQPVTGSGGIVASPAAFQGGVAPVDPNAGGGPKDPEWHRVMPIERPKALQRLHEGQGAFAARPAALHGEGEVDQERVDEEALLVLV